MRESMTQLLHVMFNMVSHEYRNMLEQGLIGNEAFGWLSESVGAAVECTDGELGHVRAEDFGRFKIIKAAMAGNCANRNSVVFQTTASDPILMVFEPAIVEYLVLEESVSAESWADALPSWSCIRRFGYCRTQSRVESLWAFIEVHTKVINESPSLRRYPHLLDFLRAIVEEARRDLSILEDLKRRRFMYCRHFLALRVILIKKLEKLQAATRQGWLSSEDCEGLYASLWDRLRQVERFIPSIASLKKRRWGISLVNPRRSSMDTILPHPTSLQDNTIMPFDPCRSQTSDESGVVITRDINALAPPAKVSRRHLSTLLAPISHPEAHDQAWCTSFGRVVGRPAIRMRSVHSVDCLSAASLNSEALAATAMTLTSPTAPGSKRISFGNVSEVSSCGVEQNVRMPKDMEEQMRQMVKDMEDPLKLNSTPQSLHGDSKGSNSHRTSGGKASQTTEVTLLPTMEAAEAPNVPSAVVSDMGEEAGSKE